MKYKRLAITGATGYVGNVVSREAIGRGYRVRALFPPNDPFSDTLSRINCEKFEGDICDVDYLSRAFSTMDAVVHTAGLISLHGDRGGLMEKINREGTRSVLRAVIRAGVKRLVHVSSIHAIEHNEHSPIVNESLPLALHHRIAYNRSKAEAEQLLLNQSEFKNIVIVLPTGIIGPFDYRGSYAGQAGKSLHSEREFWDNE